MKKLVIVLGLLNQINMFATNFDPFGRVEPELIHLSSGDDIDEDSYSVIVMIDKKTGVRLLAHRPQITRGAVEDVRMANRYNTPIYYSYEKLARDWRQTDKRFMYPNFDLFVSEDYEPNPFNSLLRKTSEWSRRIVLPEDGWGPVMCFVPNDLQKELEWEKSQMQTDTIRFYEHSLKNSLKHHLIFGSAAHYGLVNRLFDCEHNSEREMDAYYEFVKLVGPAPQISDLPKIASFKSQAVSTGGYPSVYKNGYFQSSAKKMIAYVAIMLKLPISEVANYFEKVDPQDYLCQVASEPELYRRSHYLALAADTYAEIGAFEKAVQCYEQAIDVTDCIYQKQALTKHRNCLKKHYEATGTSILYDEWK